MSARAIVTTISAVNVLLIQIRRRSDPMARHEAQCVTRRLAGHDVSLTTCNAFEDLADIKWLQGQDAIIIGGSGAFSVHHPLSKRWVPSLRVLLEEVLKTRVPGFGICFGHQLLGRHLGAQVATKPEHAEVGTIPVELTQAGQNDDVFGHLESPFEVHTGHSDCVMSIPDGVTLLAETTICQTQAFKVDDAPFYSAQFHPDISGQEARDRYVAYQVALHGDVPAATASNLERYQPGRDISCTLLGRFIEQVAAG